jgi:ketosteroid isomerase-like protein
LTTQASSDVATAASNGQAGAAEFVRRFEGAWATSKVEALLELLTEDVVLVQPGMPSTEGKEAARKVFARLLRLIPDLHVEVHRWAARDEVVFIEFTLVGTFGGREVSWPAVDRFLIRDGLAAERLSYFDPLQPLLATATRPKGWGRLLRSGFRPTLRPPANLNRRSG